MGWQSLLQGWFLSVALKGATGQAAALPPCSPSGRLSFVRWDNLSQRVGACLQAPALGETENFLATSNVLQA